MASEANLGSASVAALKQYILAAESLGIDAKSLLTRCKLEACFNNPEKRISGRQMQSVLKDLIELSEHPCFGLYSAQFVRPESYSLLGFIGMSSSNLGQALDAAMPYEKIVGDMGYTQYHSEKNQLIMRWHCNYDDPFVVPHMVDNVLASWVNFTRWLTGQSDLTPIEVHFQHSATDELTKNYEDVFRCKVSFNQEYSQLIAEKTLLETPILMPNHSLLELLTEQAEHQTALLTQGDDICFRVQQLIRQQLNKGELNRDIIAQQLHMSSRTLQRKLSAYDTSFTELCDQVRLGEAKRLLNSPHMQLEQLAQALGFSESSALQRWFRRITGQSARKFAQAIEQQSSFNEMTRE